MSTALTPERSGTAEGVRDGRRPARVQIDDSGRRGPFSRRSTLLATSSPQLARSATRSTVRTYRVSVARNTRASTSLRTGPDRAHRWASTSSTSSTRSHTRSQLRRAATTTNGSTSAASVHARGRERCTPSSSRKNTRSSPHVRRATTNTNARPHQGWNGCATRTVRCPPAPSGAVASEGERAGRIVRRQFQDRADRRPRLAHPSPARARHRRIHRLVQPRRPTLSARLRHPSRTRAPIPAAAGQPALG